MTELVRFEMHQYPDGTEYEVRDLNGGVQVMIRFANGFGASIVRHAYSYGFDRGLWEAAPVKFTAPGLGPWEFVGQSMDLPGFEHDDVRGWMDETDIDEFLGMVKSLTQTGLPSSTKIELASE